VRHTLVATSQPLTLGKRVPQVLDTENNEYRKCFSLSAHTAYAHTSYLQCFLPFAFHSQRPVRFSAARPFLSALELPKRKRATLEPAAAARQDAGHVGFIHLGHTRLCKVFGGAAHYGSVTAYQKPFFNVVYDDGHNEVMTGNQLAPLLRVDDAAFADPRRWAFDWTIMTMLKVQGFLPQIASYVRSFGLSLPAQWLGHQVLPAWTPQQPFCKRRRFFSPTSIDGPSQTPVRTGLWPTTRTPPLSSCGSP